MELANDDSLPMCGHLWCLVRNGYCLLQDLILCMPFGPSCTLLHCRSGLGLKFVSVFSEEGYSIFSVTLNYCVKKGTQLCDCYSVIQAFSLFSFLALCFLVGVPEGRVKGKTMKFKDLFCSENNWRGRSCGHCKW